MAPLTGRRRLGRSSPGARGADLRWLAPVGGLGAIILAGLLQYSLQAACAFVLVVLVVALHEHDRRWGVAAMFGFWLLAPGMRRVFGLYTGHVENDPLSLAPFLATGAIATVELARTHIPSRLRTLMLMAAAGFSFGVPVGLLFGPQAAAYTFVAYVAGLSGLVLGFNESLSVHGSTLRRVLLFGLPPIAAYAVAQRYLPLPPWDQHWLDSVDFNSIGAPGGQKVRVFASLNSPGTLAPLLCLSLLTYLTVTHHRVVAVAGAALICVALSLTFVRSAWAALIVAGLAHVIASRGRSARLIFGSGATIVAATIALSPVSPAAHDVLNRFKTLQHFRGDTSAQERSTSVHTLFPKAISAPVGHGLGSAGEPSKLNGTTDLRAPDNGYLSLMYQVGPLGFLLVVVPLGFMAVAAWNGARARAPGQEMRQLLFAMLALLLFQLYAGDVFYGGLGVILWFIGGQALAYEYRRRQARTEDREVRIASA